MAPHLKPGVSHFSSTLQINKARRTPRSPPENGPFRARTTSPGQKINTFLSRPSSPSLRGSGGAGARAELQGERGAPETPAPPPPPASSAAGATPPPSLPGRGPQPGARGARTRPSAAPGAGEGGSGRRAPGRRGCYFDGKKKKVKLDQPARHPAGSGGEEPEGKCRSGRRLFQVEGEARRRVV